jgi:hypothetical protein
MKRLRSSGSVSTLDRSGSVDVLKQITDNLMGIQGDVSQLITEYNTEVYSVISSLPQGTSDTRWNLLDNTINPRINNLDGSNIFVDTDASLVLDSGRFWDSSSNRNRPKTIKESLLSLYTDLSTNIDEVRAEIGVLGSGTSLSIYNTSLLPGNIVGDDIRSIIFDGTKIQATSAGTNTVSVAIIHAIHDNVASEISAITQKVTPVSNDILLIEDSADSNNKKRITIGAIAGSASGTLQQTYAAGNTITATAGNGDPTISIADTANAIGLRIAQSDTTNNPDGIYIANTTTSDAISIAQTGAGRGLFINHDNIGNAIEVDGDVSSASDIYGLAINVANAGAGDAYSLSLVGDIDITTGATTVKLVDHNASALSFDADGKAGILELVTTNTSEQVTMSGNLEISNNSATLTHSGTTSLTIASTSGTVIVEGATFNGTVVTGLTALTSTALTGTLQTAAQTNITSLGTLTGLVLSGNAEMSGNTATLTHSGTTSLTITSTSGNIVVEGATFNGTVVTGLTALTSTALTGTLQTAAQTNVTSLGTLTGLVLSGNMEMSGNTVTLTHSGTTSLTITSTSGTVIVEGATFTGTVVTGLTALTSTALTGTLQTAAQTNVTSLGTLTALTLSGNMEMSNNTATLTHSGTTSLTITSTSGTIVVEGATFTGTVVTGLTALTSTALTGTLQTAAQANVTSLGTLTGLTLSGDLTLTGAAVDVDLIDDNTSALSFDTGGLAGILELVTSNGSEGVKMSGPILNVANLPSGATAVAAGAAAGELWVTSGHATQEDGTVMRA